MSLGWLALCLCSDATDPNLCFQIAVENGFGGAYGREKADWLVDVVQQYFHDNCKYVSWQPLATCGRREAANWAPRRSLSFLGPGCAPHSEKGARLLPMSSLRHLCGTRRARSGDRLAILTGGPSPADARHVRTCAFSKQRERGGPARAHRSPAGLNRSGGQRSTQWQKRGRVRADCICGIAMARRCGRGGFAAARRAHPLVAGAVVSTSLWTCRVPEMKPSRVGTLLWLRPHLESSGHPSRAAADG